MMSRQFISVRKIIIMLCMAVMLFFVAQPTALAEKTCTCYCSVEEIGATDVGEYTNADCQEKCANNDRLVAAWACTADQLPSRNPFCFTEAQCSGQDGNFDKKQPAECQPGMHYCFPDSDISVDLSVAIGALDQAEDLGEYMEAVYVWMIGSATLFAIIMIMIGGLQYAMAAGSGQVGQAKKRILNGVVGLMLLLSAYLILYTVNPQLVRLEVPTFPMIRQVALASGDSCGYLTGKWGTQAYHTFYGAPGDSPYTESEIRSGAVSQAYVVDNPTDGTNCGSIAEVIEDEEGNEVLSGSTCVFDYCPKNSDGSQPQCVGEGDTAECLTCAEITPDSQIVPSAGVCGAVGVGMRDENLANSNPHDNVYKDCFYTRDPSLFVGASDVAAVVAAGVVTGGAATFVVGGAVTADIVSEIETGTCAAITVDCSGKTWCGDYDNVPVSGNGYSSKLDSMGDGGLFGGTTDLRSVCSNDPCELAPPGESCAVVEGEFTWPIYGASAWNCVNNGSIGRYEYTFIAGIAVWESNAMCKDYNGNDVSC